MSYVKYMTHLDKGVFKLYTRAEALLELKEAVAWADHLRHLLTEDNFNQINWVKHQKPYRYLDSGNELDDASVLIGAAADLLELETTKEATSADATP